MTQLDLYTKTIDNEQNDFINSIKYAIMACVFLHDKSDQNNEYQILNIMLEHSKYLPTVWNIVSAHIHFYQTNYYR